LLNISRWNPWIGCLLVASLGLAGCAPKTTVSTTGNVPAAYTHAYMSAQAIWFNTDSAATPDDTTWLKYTLTTPVTVDLSTSTTASTQLQAITTGLGVPIGLYTQIRLMPVDPTTTVLTSATALGATFNSEVDYTDSNGTAHQVPLELLNPDKGIGITTSVQVTGTGVNILASPSSSSTSDTSDSSSSDSSSSSTSSKPFSLAINVDGAKDLVPFTYDITTQQPAMLLNPHMTAYDASAVGAIQGTVDVSNISDTATIENPSNSLALDIQATAESLSTDGTRHLAVISVPVRSDGTFTLYPLSTSSASPTSYDVVIHGKGIATAIIKGVTVSVGDPTTTTPVSIGTVTARSASSFAVTLAAMVSTTASTTTTTTTPLPAGAMVGFYQTLPGNDGEVPYLIELKTIDPFTRAFATSWPVEVTSSSIDYGTFSSSGSTIALTTSNPTEGAATYRVAATAPFFTDGDLTTNPVVINSSTTVALTFPTMVPASGVSSVGTVVQIAKSGSYDRGDLIISRDGAVVSTAVLDTVLSQSGTRTLAIQDLPAISDTALYYVSVRVWNSSNPTGTVKREIYPAALDLRSLSTVTYSLNID
jgi:hypothetical protein